MKAIRCYLRRDGYRVDDGFTSLYDDRDDEKAIKALRKHLHAEMRSHGYDPDDDGHRFALEVRADNGDHLMDVRVIG